MRDRIILSASVAVLVVGVVAMGLWAEESKQSPSSPAAAVGQPAPGFSLVDQSGKTLSLSDYAGKVVVLEWVNPECPFVQRHYRQKTMATLAEKYRDQGVVWLAINSTHNAGKETNAQWVREHSLSYPILDDSSGNTGKAYGAKTTPHMFIIDRGGTLVYAGGIDNDPSGTLEQDRINYVQRALDEVLAGKPVSMAATKSYGCGVKYAR